MKFPGLILHKLATNPQWPVIEQEANGRTIFADEFYSMIERIATGMLKQGLKQRDCVIFTLDVSARSVAAYLAAYACGYTVIHIRPGYSQQQIDHMIAQTQGRLLDNHAIATLLENPGQPLELITTQPEDIAYIAYTSGSTGKPKGCVVRYDALEAHWSVNEENLSDAIRQYASHTRRFLLYGTLASTVIQDFFTLTLSHGGTLVIPDTEKPLFPEVIQRLGITATLMNVPRFNAMMEQAALDQTDLSCAEAIIVSGSLSSPANLIQACERFGPIIYNVYGQTEASCISMNTPQDILNGWAASVGRPLDNVEVKILNNEVYVRNPAAAQQYWQADDLTAEVFDNGWIRTRDCGYLEDGYLFLTGRARDVIMVNALPVYAGPIEQALCNHPGIAQAYVVGIPDTQTGESVQAFVIPHDKHPVNTQALQSSIENELGASSVPQNIHQITQVPELPSGKVDKQALAKMLQ